MVGFSSASTFLARKWEAVTQGGTRGIDHLTQGVGTVKGWEDERDRGRFPDTFTYNKNNTSAGPLTPNN